MSTTTATRSLLFSASLLFLLGQIPAQENRVRWKVKTNYEANPDEGVGPAKVVPGDAGCLVMLYTKGGQTVIGGVPQATLDPTLICLATDKMTEVKRDKTKILWGEGPVAIETIERFAGQFRVICSKPDPENAKLLLLQQVQSPRSLTGKGAQLIYELPYDRLGKGPEYYQANMAVGFTTTMGVDSTKLLLGLTPQSTQRSAGCPIFAIMLNKSMQPLWTNTLATDGTAKKVDIISTKVDKAGAVWYLIRNITNTDPKTKGDLGYSYSIYKLDSAGQQSAKLELAGKDYAQDATMEFAPNGDFVLAGVYGNEATNRNESVGIYKCTFDTKTLKFDHFSLIPFVKQVIKKEETWQVNMRIDRIMPKKDGGAYVVARRSGIETHFVSDLSGKKTPKTEQVDGMIHFFELTPTGEQKWYTRIDHQLGYDNAIPGTVISTSVEDVPYLFYNDLESNIDRRKTNVPVYDISSSKDALIVEFKPDGSPKEKVVLKEGYKQIGLQPSPIFRLGNDRIFTLGSSGFGKDKTWPVLIEFTKDAKK